MDACERTGSFAGILYICVLHTSLICSCMAVYMFIYTSMYVHIEYMLSGMVVYGSRMQCSAVIWAALLLHCMVFYRHVELYHVTHVLDLVGTSTTTHVDLVQPTTCRSSTITAVINSTVPS